VLVHICIGICKTNRRLPEKDVATPARMPISGLPTPLRLLCVLAAAVVPLALSVYAQWGVVYGYTNCGAVDCGTNVLGMWNVVPASAYNCMQTLSCGIV